MKVKISIFMFAMMVFAICSTFAMADTPTAPVAVKIHKKLATTIYTHTIRGLVAQGAAYALDSDVIDMNGYNGGVLGFTNRSTAATGKYYIKVLGDDSDKGDGTYKTLYKVKDDGSQVVWPAIATPVSSSALFPLKDISVRHIKFRIYSTSGVAPPATFTWSPAAQ